MCKVVSFTPWRTLILLLREVSQHSAVNNLVNDILRNCLKSKSYAREVVDSDGLKIYMREKPLMMLDWKLMFLDVVQVLQREILYNQTS